MTTNTRGVMFQYFEWNNKNDGSLWRELKERAYEIKNLGTTAIWFPPAQKCLAGIHDTGYAPYDLYDLGEFDQKGTVRTKYGTKDEFIEAVNAVREAGMDVYCDIVLDHRMGGDEIEEVEVQQVNPDDRNQVIGEPYKIKAYSKYLFTARAGKYSSFTWDQSHFLAFGYDHNHPEEKGRIYRRVGKNFSGEVDFEHGNFDYLMGADVDHYHPDVRREEVEWGKWFVQQTQMNGFRLDAVKHIPASFYKYWLACMREFLTERELFAVGEYWSADLNALKRYIDQTGGTMRLFDVPLHFRLMEAGQKGRDYDIRTIFDGTLVKEVPLLAVTFVDNHDSQPGQALQSWIVDWFKPIAYALILLREHGYPCLFYGDYFGNPGDEHGNNKLMSHRKLIDDFLQARAKHTYGVMTDYFDHPTCVGWTWSGDHIHPGGLAVVLSTGDPGTKRMKTTCSHQTFRDVTSHWGDPVTTDEHGEGEFHCRAGSVSVWAPV